MAGFVGVAVTGVEVETVDDGAMGVKRKRWICPLGMAACISC